MLQTKNEISRLLRQQSALARFGSYAFREPVLQNILSEAARVCAEGLAVPFCKICRYRTAEKDLLIEAGFGWEPGIVGLVVSKADETTPQGRAFVTGEPVIIDNVRHANNMVLPAFYAQHGIISTIDVLIKRIDGPPFGVLEIDSPVQEAYDEHDVDFLTGFANVLAEAVATSDRNETLHRTLEVMSCLLSEKEDLLIERAVLAEELKHRVRNNLQLVHGMLASHVRNTPQSEERASIDGIIRRVMTLAEVYEQLLGSGMNHKVDLGDYLQSLCRKLPGLQTTGVENQEIFCKTETLLVDLDTVTAMGMVVAELVSNSYEHASSSKGIINVVLKGLQGHERAILTDGVIGASSR